MKLWGWKVIDIQVGNGPTWVSIGKFSINKIFFLGGRCNYERPDDASKYKRAIVHAGGIIFNLLSIGVLYFLSVYIKTDVIGYINFVSCIVILTSIIPSNALGVPSDGKQLLQLFKEKNATLE